MSDKFVKAVVEEYNLKFPSKKFVPGQSYVPVSGKVFDEKEMILASEAVLEGWWTEGKFSILLEQKFSKWLGVRHVAFVNSGSSANLLAISALTSYRLGDRRLKPGDEVVTVAAGFPSTVNPIIQNGLVPVFLDIELGYYNIDISKIKEAIGPKTKAIFIAHTLGNPFNLNVLGEICKEYNLWLIEDNCDALGSMYDGKLTGTFGHIATCSFYPAHHITMGEGGAVFTNDDLLHNIVVSMRDWGRDCYCMPGRDNTCGKRFGWKLGSLPFGYDHKYIYSEIGYNLKLTDMQAALGLAQLDKLDGFIEKRQENFSLLYDFIKQYEEFFVLPKWLENSKPSWFGFLLTVKESAPFSRDEIVSFLLSKKIATRYLFAGNLLKQPYFVNNEINYRTVGDFVNTDIVMNRTFWIGVYPGINKEMIDWVTGSFEDFLQKF
jgi:CDP-6-deoxy-D-xylo-4-hexulose-3-dehydrase